MKHMQHILIHPLLSQTDIIHIGIWNIEPSHIITTRVTFIAQYNI